MRNQQIEELQENYVQIQQDQIREYIKDSVQKSKQKQAELMKQVLEQEQGVKKELFEALTLLKSQPHSTENDAKQLEIRNLKSELALLKSQVDEGQLTKIENMGTHLLPSEDQTYQKAKSDHQEKFGDIINELRSLRMDISNNILK